MEGYGHSSELALLAVIAACVGGCCGGDTLERPDAVESRPARSETSSASVPARPVGSPNARPELAVEFLADQTARRHQSDGGGSVRIVEGPDEIVAGQSGRWVFEYTAGSMGVDVGGAIYFLGSPFWGWSPPQTDTERRPGFCRLSTDADGVKLEVAPFPAGGIIARVVGARLRVGQSVEVEYGAGPSRAFADSYAERGSPFRFAVDGDGDGVREDLLPPPTVRVRPGPAARLLATAPSVARPGTRIALVVAALDDRANAAEHDGELRLSLVDAEAAGVHFPERVRMTGGRARVPVTVREAGVYRFEVRGAGSESALAAKSNPLLVEADGSGLFWLDLHGHSASSDGTGTPDDYYAYARDVAGLDGAALTDHDHFGIPALDRVPSLWEELRAAARRADRHGAFLALVGFEWTSWLYGHQHVVFFGERAEVFSSLDPRFDTPAELWAAVGEAGGIATPHHPAGAPVATDWSAPPPGGIVPVVEITSVHGISEARDVTRPARGFVPGNGVRAALSRGYRFGFVGGGDTHDGHPGLGHLGPHYGYRAGAKRSIGNGGVAAVLAKSLDRGAVLEALRARRCYATTGPRIFVRVTLAGHPLGSIMKASELDDGAPLDIFVIGTAPVERVDIVRSGAVARDVAPALSGEQVVLTRRIHPPVAGEYLYVRVLQEDGALAWTSPFFFE